MLNADEKKRNRKTGLIIFFSFIGIVLLMNISEIFATGTETEKITAVENITQIKVNDYSDCLKNPNPYYYRDLTKQISQSQCFKDFLSEYPSDRDTTKSKSITINLLCKTGTTTGNIKGVVTLVNLYGNKRKNFVMNITITDNKLNCETQQIDKFKCLDNECLTIR
jgi:hypothetical protein